MLALVLALGPSLLVVVALASRHPGEVRRLGGALVAGGLGGLAVVELLPHLGTLPAGAGGGPWAEALRETWARAALPEETVRLVAVLLAGLPGRPGQGTWIRVGAAAGVGYAAFENTLHALARHDGVHVVALRAVTSLPAHALFGVLMGALAGRGGPRAWLGAWLAAMALHVAYDAPLLLVARHHGRDPLTVSAVLVFAAVLVGGWLAARALARRAALEDAAAGRP